MPQIEYEVALDETALEWMRVRFATVRGQVMTFAIQYETTDHGERVPVVRYDNAHGFAHRDVLNRRGQIIDKRPIAGAPEPNIALNVGERDIQENWERYRRAFFGDDR
jgi:hypothetical protein